MGVPRRAGHRPPAAADTGRQPAGVFRAATRNRCFLANGPVMLADRTGVIGPKAIGRTCGLGLGRAGSFPPWPLSRVDRRIAHRVDRGDAGDFAAIGAGEGVE